MKVKRIRSLSVFIFLILSLCSGNGFSQEAVTVSASADKRSAQVNQEIALSIKVEGAQGNIQAPRLPNLQGFDAFYTGRASHISFVNGKSSSLVEFSYVLVPKKEGRFTLPAIDVMVGSQTFKTQPLELTVSGTLQKPPYQTSQAPPPGTFPAPQQQTASSSSSSPAAQAPAVQEPPPTFQPEDENIFVKAWVDKATVYPNQQILLTYSLYTRYDTRYEGFQDEPQISGFWIEEFPQDREVQRETVRMNGLRYVKADIKKVALFPTTAAEYTIQPGVIKVSIRQEPQTQGVFDEFFNDNFFSSGGFFSRRENRLLQPPPIKINVIPFPEEGKPASFQGAVGNFRMSAAVDKQSVKQNEPVSLKMTIEGEGSIETLNKPKAPEIKGVRTYDADTASQLFQTGDVIGGRKTFETVFIPMEAGTLTIPKVEFSFFNPATRTYQTLTTQPFTVAVEKSDQAFKLPAELSQQEAFKKDIEVEGKDIHFIDEKLPNESRASLFRYVLSGLAGADVFLLLLLLYGFWQIHQDRIFSKDNALKRRLFARSQAEGRMRKIKKLAHSHKVEGSTLFFEEIDKTLTQYLTDKFGLSAYGVTRDALEKHLLRVLGENEPLFREILKLYQICDESRFAKADIEPSVKQDALKILKHTIEKVERIKKR